MASTASVRKRIANLKEHLASENPDLAGLVASYEQMDSILRRLHLLGADETLTTRISWWPVVATLGMFSAGKSTSINDFLGQRVQRTSKQAQDDKFTVLCYGPENAELPGTALAVDSRFPFYGMSDEIEKVSPGEGKMVDSFLALKTVPSDALRGLILVDSPGFDSDNYRAGRLKLADHILDLSDLVLIYCDANRPEPGAMRDTLDLLVSKSQHRSDADKFIYVLNQIDVAAHDNNIEEVIAAWQRALATTGLTTGRFYTVYSESAKVAIADPTVAARLKELRDRDMADIHTRIGQLQSKRSYRVVNALQAVEKDAMDVAVPMLNASIKRWSSNTHMALGAACAGVLALEAGGGLLLAGDPSSAFTLAAQAPHVALPLYLIAAAAAYWKLGSAFAAREARKLPEKLGDFDLKVREAFLKATRLPPVLVRHAPGTGTRTTLAIATIHDEVSDHVRIVNDRYARPSSLTAPMPGAA